ncbi:MAG: hypothetical protein EBR58_08840 [Betaproteobacteria bacterium]|nr:hypothetical protein [Betaproteobacteria bacterium]
MRVLVAQTNLQLHNTHLLLYLLYQMRYLSIHHLLLSNHLFQKYFLCHLQQLHNYYLLYLLFLLILCHKI